MPVSINEAGRYGVNAMELLINEAATSAPTKRKSGPKVFGGGTVSVPFAG
jgi:chemotaxis receptor (MCP) glutamine deamidase CheD